MRNENIIEFLILLMKVIFVIFGPLIGYMIDPLIGIVGSLISLYLILYKRFLDQ